MSLRIPTAVKAIVMTFAMSASVWAQEDQPALDSAAMKLAKELTDAGTRMFAAGDGVGLAAQYADNAELVEKTVEAVGPPTVKIRRGKEAISKIYENVSNLTKFNLTNEVHFARHVTPDTLFIAGDLLMNENGVTKRLPFSQVRVKSGDSWKIVCLELSLTR